LAAVSLVQRDVARDVGRNRLLGHRAVGPEIGKRTARSVIGRIGTGRPGLKVVWIWSRHRVAFGIQLGLARLLIDHDVAELLPDDLGADELAGNVDLLAVGISGERDLADAGDDQRVDDPQQEREDEDPDRGGDDVAFDGH
jgi:hypothetical protein